MLVVPAQLLVLVYRRAALRRVVSALAGACPTVTFTLGSQNLGYYNNAGQFVVTPGQFNLWVSDSSVVGSPTTFTVN